jgi:hypothetical protein
MIAISVPVVKRRGLIREGEQCAVPDGGWMR